MRLAVVNSVVIINFIFHKLLELSVYEQQASACFMNKAIVQFRTAPGNLGKYSALRTFDNYAIYACVAARPRDAIFKLVEHVDRAYLKIVSCAHEI